MAVRALCITDPACVWSWAFEPVVRGLMVEFGDDLEWTFVMGGLAREYGADAGWGSGDGKPGLAQHWLEATDESGMPTDPLVWSEGPLSSTYPACMAVKAAQEQGRDAAYRYLRALREGILCRRRKLDAPEALVEEARGAGLDVERFRLDLGSHAIVEAFGADLERARDVPDVVRQADKVRCSVAVGEERVPFPTLRFEGDGGDPRWTCGMRPYDFVREQAIAAGAQPTGESRPTVLDAVRRFGSIASVEVAAVCDLPLPRAEAELAQLALDWKVKPLPVLAGKLWELA
ncbi:MAG TPA: DsbA family protein [Thermoleophilaceae bacterium]|nr:DsbA family protein [Thermoleophilaceae bacterium]